jgi:hypothetical protein
MSPRITTVGRTVYDTHPESSARELFADAAAFEVRADETAVLTVRATEA